MTDATQAFAATFVDELAACGLRHVCISPGSRSAPLAMAFARHPEIRTWIHVDERSGSFFAVGLAKRTSRPVAVLCTSGSAAAEFHPAVLEAHHSNTPLLVLTADRPPELRDRGANQVIDQAAVFGAATRWSFDPGPPRDTPQSARTWRHLAARAVAMASGGPAGPVHLNLPFREPLVPEPGTPPVAVEAGPRPALEVHAAVAAPAAADVDWLAGALRESHHPLVVAGAMIYGARLSHAVAALATAHGLVVLAEPTSQLRRLGLPGVVDGAEALLRDPGFAAGHQPDLVIFLGRPPTSKILATWLAAADPREVVMLHPDGTWWDPASLATRLIRADPDSLLAAVAGAGGEPSLESAAWQADWVDAGRGAAAAMRQALVSTRMFEGHVIRALAAALPDAATVVVGSSLAIRDVDWFWPPDPGRHFLANRGTSGIDGFVSTVLGAAAVSPTPTIALLGDLTLYHDMNGLWAARRHGVKAIFVVLNNDGGGIFSHLPEAAHGDVFEEVFGTPLGLDLGQVAALYRLDYARVDDDAGIQPAVRAALAAPGTVLIDVRLDRQAGVAGHRAAWAAAAAAIPPGPPAGR